MISGSLSHKFNDCIFLIPGIVSTRLQSLLSALTIAGGLASMATGTTVCGCVGRLKERILNCCFQF
jgi:hypothetical protein